MPKVLAASLFSVLISPVDGGFSETSVRICQPVRHHNAEDLNLHVTANRASSGRYIIMLVCLVICDTFFMISHV
jgi:hypothetical protein